MRKLFVRRWCTTCSCCTERRHRARGHCWMLGSFQSSSETNMRSMFIRPNLLTQVCRSSEFMQEQRQGSVGRIGHSLSAAALLLDTCILISDAETHVPHQSYDVWYVASFSVGPSCCRRIVVIAPLDNGSPLGQTHDAAKEDQERRA